MSITGNEKYGIYWMHNALTNLLFNDASLTAGQEISVGGPDPTASPVRCETHPPAELGL